MVDSYMILFWIAFVVAISAVLIAWTIRLPEKDIIRNKEKLSLDRFFFLTRTWLLAINIAMFGFCWGVFEQLSRHLQQGGFVPSQEEQGPILPFSLWVFSVLVCRAVKPSAKAS